MNLKGSITVYFLILTCLIILVAFTVSNLLLGEHKVISSKVESEQAYYNAEAGFKIAIKRIEKEGITLKDFSYTEIFDENNNVKITLKNDRFNKKFLINVMGKSFNSIKAIAKEEPYSK